MQSINRVLPTQADFRSRFGRQTESLLRVDQASNFNVGDPLSTLNTVAFLFLNPKPHQLSSFGVRTAMLAFYAAGADISLTQSDLWELKAEPDNYARQFKLPEHKGNRNGELVSFAVNRAMERGHRERLPKLGRHEAPLTGRLIRIVEAAISKDLLEGDHTVALATAGFLGLNPDPAQCTADKVALAMLAAWAGGASISISSEQYDLLCKNVQALSKEYSPISGYNQSLADLANFVLTKANQRIKTEALVI